MKAESKNKPLNKIIPVGYRILFRKDEDRTMTKGGIALPDDVKIPVISGRVLEISDQVSNDDDYSSIKQYDKVLVDPLGSIPVDFEDKKLFVIPVENVIAIIGRKDDE